MVTSKKWFEEAMIVQAEILSDCEELSIGLVRKRSPDSALIMAEYVYKHIMENSNSGSGAEFINMLKELEAFNREDKVRAIGFFYESLGANSAGGSGCDISTLKDIAKWWKLENKFDKLMKAFFTEIPPMEEEKVKEKIEDEVEEEVILVPEIKKKK